MKTMKMILLAFVLLATACSQNTTTPTTPPVTTNPCGATTNSNEFIELKINGNTFRTESYTIGGNKLPAAFSIFNTDTLPTGTRECNIAATAFGCNNTSIINTLSAKFWNKKLTNHLDPIGIYKGYGEFDCYSQANTVGFYKIAQDSITLTVTSCTANYVSGTFVGTARETNTNILYPITGSFNNIVRSGF
jgi:hypothetical protein